MLRVKFNPWGPTKEYPSIMSFLTEITGQDFSKDYQKYLSKVKKKLTKIFQGAITLNDFTDEGLLNTLVEMGMITVLINDSSPYLSKEHYSEMILDFSRVSLILHNLSQLSKTGYLVIEEEELLDLLHFLKFNPSYKSLRFYSDSTSITVIGRGSKIKEEKDNWEIFRALTEEGKCQ